MQAGVSVVSAPGIEPLGGSMLPLPLTAVFHVAARGILLKHTHETACK